MSFKNSLRWILAAFLLLAPAQVLAAGKPVVAIYQMDDLAHSGQAEALSAMIETAIESTSKFRVIERQHLGVMVGEQARAKSGLVTSNTPGKVGGFEGADFLIYGTITTLSVVSKSDIGTSVVASIFMPPNSNVNCNNTFATLGIDIKITDARTGEVRYVTRINEVQKSASNCTGQRAEIDPAALMRAAADKVANSLVTTIYPIQVAAVQADGTVILNYGEGSLTPGAVLAVYTKGEVIKDPATGEVLANDEVKLGYIRVTEIAGRVSKATPMSTFASTPPIGSIVRVASDDDIKALAKASKHR